MRKGTIYITVLVLLLTVCISLPVYAAVRATGAPIVESNLYTYDPVTGLVTQRYDYINESYTELFLPNANLSGYWNGAPSILRNGDTYYITHRVRNPGSYPIVPKRRGYLLQCNSSTDLVTWTSVWSVNRSLINNASQPLATSVESMEATSLRYYEGEYWLYFCIDANAPNGWYTWAVNSSSIANLGTQVLTGASWINISLPENTKDPRVGEIDGTYYLIVTRGLGTHKADKLYTATNPAGPFTLTANLSAVYTATYGENSGTNAGFISYDTASDYYIFNCKIEDASDGKNYDWYAVSEDLVNWTLGGRTPRPVVCRYLDMHKEMGQRDTASLVVGELETAMENGSRSTVLWQFDERFTSGAVIFSFFPLVIGVLAVSLILGLAFILKNPAAIAASAIMIILFSLMAIMLINLAMGNEHLFW